MNQYPPIPTPSQLALTKLALNPYAASKFLGSFMRNPKEIGLGGRLARWGAKQMYTFTGAIPGMSKLSPKAQKALLSHLELGVPGSRAALFKAQRGVTEATKKLQQGLGTEADVIRARKAVRSAEGMKDWAEASGGSLPGAAKALVSSPEQAKKLLVGGWKSMPTWQKAVFGGLTGKGMYDVATTPAEAYGQEGAPSGRLEHFGRELGSGVGWLATGGLPLLPMVAGSTAATSLGGLPGKLLGKRRQQEPGQVPADQLPPEAYG